MSASFTNQVLAQIELWTKPEEYPVGALDGHADVRRLLGGELRELHAEGREVEARHLLVEDLRQHVARDAS
jgi:adenosylhomocysteinase